MDSDASLNLLTPGRLAVEDALAELRRHGFDDAAAASKRLAGLCVNEAERASLARSLPALLFALRESASPDGSLLNFERFVQTRPDRRALFDYLAENPRAVEILVRLFVGSQFLTEILLRNPQMLEELTQHKRLAEFKTRQDFVEQGRATAAGEQGRATAAGEQGRAFAAGEQGRAIAAAETSRASEGGDHDRTVAAAVESPAARLDAFRRFQQWELLRLAACDSFGLMDLKTVTLQLALLADALVQLCLAEASAELGVPADDFAVIAFGKLGGEELNYSSDIDLVFVCGERAERYWGLGQRLIRALSESTGNGFLYRVDMRLRPWGRSGPLVCTADSYFDYLGRHARLWEKQALLKARVIAGAADVGQSLLERLRPLVFHVHPDEARANIREMKQRIEEELQRQGRDWGAVKGGRGSIRDVEFVAQFLQLAHGRDLPAVRSMNTLDSLVRLADLDLLPADEFRQLSTGYNFLRTVEHALQLMHNKPKHFLPVQPRELEWLAGRLDFPGAAEFLSHYEQHGRAIRRIFDKYFPPQPVDGQAGPGSEPRSVAAHLGEAAASYAELVPGDRAERHLALLERLDGSRIACVDARPTGDRTWELTVVGYDQLGDLSIICGLLFVYGFDIDSGSVITGADLAGAAPAVRTPSTDAAPRRKFVNVFHVRLAGSEPVAPSWPQYESDLADLLQRIEQGNPADAQGRLALRVARSLRRGPDGAGPSLPVEIDIENQASTEATVLRIRGDDTPGFLYELGSALAMSGISITRMQIQSEGRRVHDTLHVTDAPGAKITDPGRINELRAAIVLIKHFMHLLPDSPNPESALLHFRDFLLQLFRRPRWVEELAALQQSEVLGALARLLGVSDFLWHDFLRLQHDNLFPVVRNLNALQSPVGADALKAQLRTELAAGTTLDERRAILNAFKDREMLRVDMRHILNLQDKFGMFSRELTDVAETVVGAALAICEEELLRTHGRPQSSSGAPCRLSLCALGKFGGSELGFASDIELMFLYEADGVTAGPEPITNQGFYEMLVDGFRKSIHARRKGIFEIDLRLRPYGKAGSLAVSLEAFEKYFRPDGAAWPYERQALVKLRPVAGDRSLGARIVAIRDGIVYRGESFDAAAMRAMREKQLRQHVRAGSFNAKLSPGGLVDCEYLVQALQITYGHRNPQLRSTNTREAMRALAAAGILGEDERLRLRDAYRFLRRLIDALRMVRGDARDLTVPPPDSDQFEFLARRLDYGLRTGDLQHDLERCTSAVLEMVRQKLPAP